jgi:ABC-2 type transport system permease protein
MKFNNKKTMIKAFSLAFTVTVILIVLVFNILVGAAEKRFSLKLDMTGGKVFTLTEETKSFLSGLKEDFTINVLSDEVTYKQGVRTGIVNEILLRYKKAAGHRIKLQYIDTYTNPGILTKYQNENIEENGLIIEGGPGHKVISMAELFGTKTNDTTFKEQIVDCRAEQVITSALVKLSSDTLPKVYIVEGHGETYYDSMIKLIESGSYEISRLSLFKQDIPLDADLIIISSPKVDFSSQELSRLDDYLGKFGNMIMLYGSESPDLPNLDGYLEEWGVNFEKNIILDPIRYVGNVVQISPLMRDLEINKNFKDIQDRFLLTPGARGISILWESHNKREVNPVLVTSKKAYAKSYENESGLISSIEEKEGDEKGSANVGVLVQNYDMVDKKVQIGRVLFLSSPTMLSDSLLNTSNLLNSYYFMNTLSYMTGGTQDFVSVPSKSMKDNVLNTVKIGNLVLFGVVVILPSALILLFGILRCRFRRKL